MSCYIRSQKKVSDLWHQIFDLMHARIFDLINLFSGACMRIVTFQLIYKQTTANSWWSLNKALNWSLNKALNWIPLSDNIYNCQQQIRSVLKAPPGIWQLFTCQEDSSFSVKWWSEREVKGKCMYGPGCPRGLISSCLPNITSLLLPFFNNNELS